VGLFLYQSYKLRFASLNGVSNYPFTRCFQPGF